MCRGTPSCVLRAMRTCSAFVAEDFDAYVEARRANNHLEVPLREVHRNVEIYSYDKVRGCRHVGMAPVTAATTTPTANSPVRCRNPAAAAARAAPELPRQKSLQCCGRSGTSTAAGRRKGGRQTWHPHQEAARATAAIAQLVDTLTHELDGTRHMYNCHCCARKVSFLAHHSTIHATTRRRMTRRSRRSSRRAVCSV
jgi:hypothetical protein